MRTERIVLSTGGRLLWMGAWVALLFFLSAPVALAQGETQGGEPVPEATAEELSAPEQVDVEPVAADQEIEQRLDEILRATGWFTGTTVAVRDGVVFLDGRTTSAEYRQWAGSLAQSTQDVAAVVNRIRVVEPLEWDLSPALAEMRNLWLRMLRLLPLIGLGLLILVIAWFVSMLARRVAFRALRTRLRSVLLRSVASWLVGIPLFLLGIYIVLQIFGLTRLAVTVLGGTGLAGLIVGIAFRDIMENFLASILISVRTPFLAGDRIEVAGYTGIVQRVTTRGTVLMLLNGNHVQIPNATIYRSNIVNYTANPQTRLEFTVGIGYEDSVSDAQEIILDVLTEHPVVLDQPESLVLVEELGAATVTLNILFWINSNQHDPFKVRSSVLRMVKQVLQESGISMPDEAREVIFPQGVPIVQPRSLQTDAERAHRDGEAPVLPQQKRPPLSRESTMVATAAEGDLSSEDEQIRQQARESRSPEEGPDLLNPDEA